MNHNIILQFLLTVLCFTFTQAAANADELTARRSGPDYVFRAHAKLPQDYRFLLPLSGAETPEAADKILDCLHKTNPDQPAGVYHFTDLDRVPVAHPYVIAAAAYASETEMRTALQYVRQHFNYDKLFACLSPSLRVGGPTAGDVSYMRIPQYGDDPLDRPMADPPQFDVADQFSRTPLPIFDAIGHSNYVSNTATASAVLHYRPMTSVQEAQVMVNDYQANYPMVHFAVLQQGRFYYLTIAAMTRPENLDEAVLVARRLGLYEFAKVDNIPPTVEQFEGQLVLSVKTIVDFPPLTTPEINPSQQAASPILIEVANLVEPLHDRVQRCYQEVSNQSLAALGQPPASVEQVSSCAGLVLNSKTLTRCLLNSDCVGPAVPISIKTAPSDRAKRCLKSAFDAQIAMNPIKGQCAKNAAPGQCSDDLQQKAKTECLGTTLDMPFAQVIPAVGLQVCMESPTAANCPDATTLMTAFCAKAGAAQFCADAAHVKALAARLNALSDCAVSGKQCESVVPRFGYTKTDFQTAIADMGSFGSDPATLTATGIAFLAKGQAEMVNGFVNCQKEKDAHNQDAAACFARLGLNDSELKVYNCIMQHAGDGAAIATCEFGGSTTLQTAVARYDCMRDAQDDLARLASCAGVSESDLKAVQSAKAAADCARKYSEPIDILTSCLGAVPPALAQTLNCAKGMNDPAAVANCLPSGLGDKAATAICLAKATTDQERISCLPDFVVTIDPNAQKALACAANFAGSDGDPSQLTSCLPSPYASQASCLVSAQTDIDRAGCVAGAAGINPKTTSTVACLAKSNGETEAMAQCALGALLPASLGRIGQCATTSQGEVDFALCATAVGLNPEGRIAAECAAESGGEPEAFAGCTAGRLTMRELQKCLSGQIGTDDGCFGPNNTIVKALSSIANDLTHGLGDNNDLRKALGQITNPIRDAIGSLAHGAQQVLQGLANAADGAKSWLDNALGVHW
jgi:hypothetical protein